MWRVCISLATLLTQIIKQNFQMNKNISPLERTVLRLLASRAGKQKDLIHTQISQAKVESRQSTNVGFITKFSLPNTVDSLKTMSKRKVLEIYAEHPHTHAGAEFLLWFECGRLKYLEGYVFIGHWPTEEYNFHFLTYHDSLSADLIERNSSIHQHY